MSDATPPRPSTWRGPDGRLRSEATLARDRLRAATRWRAVPGDGRKRVYELLKRVICDNGTTTGAEACGAALDLLAFDADEGVL